MNKILFLIFVFPCLLFGQNRTIDSLKLALKNAKHDTVKLNILYNLLYNTYDVNEKQDLSEHANNLALNLAKNPNKYIQKKGLIGLATMQNNFGMNYYKLGNFTKAIEHIRNSLKMFEELSDKSGIALALNNLGIIYYEQGDISLAIQNFNKCLELRIATKDHHSMISGTMLNLGAFHYGQGDTSIALDFYHKGLKIQEENEDKRGIAISLNNIGSLYSVKGKLVEAINYFKKSLQLSKEVDDQGSVASSMNNIANQYLQQKNYSLALLYSDSSLTLSKKLGIPENIRSSEKGMTRIYKVLGNHKEAFAHYKQFIIYSDSLNNDRTRKASIKNQLKYDFEKKEAVLLEQQEKEKVLGEEKNQRQEIVIWSVTLGLLLVIVFSLFVFRTLKTTRKQKQIIEEKQKDILDSIRYAKRIQISLLPTEKYIAKIFSKIK